jgi:hypothetical protein
MVEPSSSAPSRKRRECHLRYSSIPRELRSCTWLMYCSCANGCGRSKVNGCGPWNWFFKISSYVKVLAHEWAKCILEPSFPCTTNSSVLLTHMYVQWQWRLTHIFMTKESTVYRILSCSALDDRLWRVSNLDYSPTFLDSKLAVRPPSSLHNQAGDGSIPNKAQGVVSLSSMAVRMGHIKYSALQLTNEVTWIELAAAAVYFIS